MLLPLDSLLLAHSLWLRCRLCAHPAALAAQGVEFQAPAQLQRGGLLLLDGVAYAGYGGNSGDCQECESPRTLT